MNKLVRNRIPELIEKQGETAITRILSQEEYRAALEAKLDEEVAEFHEAYHLHGSNVLHNVLHEDNACDAAAPPQSEALEELADILEVVYALGDACGYTREQLHAAYVAKHEARGGFDERIFLIAKSKRP